MNVNLSLLSYRIKYKRFAVFLYGSNKNVNNNVEFFFENGTTLGYQLLKKIFFTGLIASKLLVPFR